MQFSCLFSLAESEGILRSRAKALSVGVSLTIGLYMDGWYLTVDQFPWILYPRIAASTKSVKVTDSHSMKEGESTLKRIFQSLHSIVVHFNQNIIYLIILRNHVINCFHPCNVPLQHREQLNRVQFVDQSTVIVDCQLFSITIDLKLCFIEFLDEGSSVQLDERVRI